MNRTKLMDAIMEQYEKLNPVVQKVVLRETLKHIPDMSLIAFAQEIGIDTDMVALS